MDEDEKEYLRKELIEKIKEASKNITMWKVELYKLCELFRDEYGYTLEREENGITNETNTDTENNTL